MILGVGIKMWLGLAESQRFLGELADAAPRLPATPGRVFVLPAFPVLPAARDVLAGTGIAWGAQDGHWEDSGPHTGSVSPAMLAELGCSVVEVGHAERRRDFGEDDPMIARKAAAAARHGMTPVVCVGERDEADAAERTVLSQLRPVLEALPADAPLLVAYEPVWAIGGVRAAPAARIGRVVAALRTAVADRTGEVRLLYGGSVAPGSVRAILGGGADGVFASRSALTVAGVQRLLAAAAP